jgi:signal transduction histidine kinase
MDRMIEDLLTMARTDDTITDTEVVGLPRLARRAWETTQTEGATLVVDLPENATVEGDGDLLQHVFENLFRNAVDHNEPPLHIRVGALEGGEGFYVEDDGRGIPAGERERVFGQGHSTSDDGSGLGLSIVEEVVTAHGWRVGLTESIEGGARFEVETAPAGSAGD